MTAPFDAMAVTIIHADLDDAAVVAAIDQWVLAHPGSTPFHRPAWVKAVARATGQQAAMILTRDVAGRINGLVPITLIRSLLFGRALVSAGFAVDGGILAETDRAAEALAEACWVLARRHGCASAELRGGILPGHDWTIRTGSYVRFSRPLAASDDEELKAVPKRHRAEIRKSIEAGLDFEIGRDARMRAVHYRLYAENVHRLGTPVFPRSLFDAVLDDLGDAADIAIVSKDGVVLSSVITLWHGDAVMPYWHGAAMASRATRSNEYLYFRLMGVARERGFTLFDFGRSKVGTGPAAWKRNWGFEPVPLGYAVRAMDGKEVRDVNPLSPRYARKVEMWKRIPLPVANLIGPWLAKGLG